MQEINYMRYLGLEYVPQYLKVGPGLQVVRLKVEPDLYYGLYHCHEATHIPNHNLSRVLPLCYC